jgi:hypothetical protein
MEYSDISVPGTELTLSKPVATLMAFTKDGVTGAFDIVDGKFDYTGELPITEAAKCLFETLAAIAGPMWIERAMTPEQRAAMKAALEG